MNLLHTFWNSQKQENPLLNAGGFLAPEIHFMSWAFSCLQLRKFYPNVELHTNQQGKEILIDCLELPYSKVHLSLETEFMENLHPNMWAYSKIHTYSLQKEPFLHVDGDVFIWKPFEEKLLQGDLIAQNIEDFIGVYAHSLETIIKNADYVPNWIPKDSKSYLSYNAGILGGTHLDFYSTYTQIAFEFYEKNKNCFDKLSKIDTNVNTIPEQYLFNVLVQQQNVNVNCYSDKVIKIDSDFLDYVDIASVPKERTYFHVLGQFKQRKEANQFINFLLKKEYPEFWQKIVTLFTEQNCVSPYFKSLLEAENNTSSISLYVEKDENKKYKKLTKQCEILDVNFTGIESIKHDKRLVDLYHSAHHEEEIVNEFPQIQPNKNIKPFPLYEEATNLYLNEKELLSSYILVNENHYLKSYKYDWLNLRRLENPKYKDLTPYLSYVLYHHFPNSSFLNEVVMEGTTLLFFEKLKEKPITVKEFLKYINNIDAKADEKDLLKLLKNWYSSGLIYFSKDKKDFIPQEPCKIFQEHQNNLKNQVATCIKYVLTHYKIENYNQKLISKFEKVEKNISLLEITQTFEKLNFETKGVRGTIESLSQIPLPAVAMVKLRDSLSLYVVITKVTDEHITIFNTELNEEEEYSMDYFPTIWEGILVLMLPK